MVLILLITTLLHCFGFASETRSVNRPPSQIEEGQLLVEVRSGSLAIPGARVLVGELESLTDTEGRTEMTLPVGTLTISVLAEGFHETRLSATVEKGITTQIEVELSPRVEIHEEVIVTAARTDSRLEDQPVRIEVVDREDIEEKALMTPGSVAMLLGETTGLRVQTTSPSIGAANVRIQGLRGRYTRLLSDGLPLYGLQGDSLSLLQVPPLDLGQVEIVKGAASALYGASALGGVINLVSQQSKTRHRELLLNASTQEAGDLVFWMVEPPKDNWAFTLLGGLHGQRRQDLDKDGWIDLPTFERGVLRPRLFWENAGGRSIFATAGVMAENRRGGTMPAASAPDGQPFPQALDSRRIDAGTQVRLPAGGSKLFTVRASFSYRGEERTFGDSFERGRRLSWLTEGFVQGSAGRHLWLLGAAIQQDNYHNRDLSDFNFDFVTPGLIAQDEIMLSQKLTLGISARIDSHNQYGTFASPRLSLLWKAAPGCTARFSAGTGFFAPTPFVEETEETGFSRLLPLQGLVAERARSASFDTSWSRGPIELVATVFGSVVHEPVEWQFVGTDRVALVNAIGPVRTWGTEFLARYRREGFLLLLTHNYTSSTEQDPDVTGRRKVPLTPRNLASLNAFWEGESWGRIGLEAYYVGRQPLEYNPYRLEGRGYLLVGALAEHRFGSFRVFLNLENLTNVRQTRWNPLVRPAQLPDGRWTVDAWAPLDGRVINGGIRLMF